MPAAHEQWWKMASRCCFQARIPFLHYRDSATVRSLTRLRSVSHSSQRSSELGAVMLGYLLWRKETELAGAWGSYFSSGHSLWLRIWFCVFSKLHCSPLNTHVLLLAICFLSHVFMIKCTNILFSENNASWAGQRSTLDFASRLSKKCWREKKGLKLNMWSGSAKHLQMVYVYVVLLQIHFKPWIISTEKLFSCSSWYQPVAKWSFKSLLSAANSLIIVREWVDWWY